MNIEEAKLILAAYRPGTADDADPHFAEALKLVRTDAELAAWFKAEQAADAALRAKLKSTPLPDDLLANIQSGLQERLNGRPRRNPFPLALAASIVVLGLLAGLLVFRPDPKAVPGSFAAFREDMSQQLQTMPSLDFNTDRLVEVREWLAKQPLGGEVELPEALTKFPSLGCRTMDWNGHKAALVCFMIEGEVLHVLVMPKGDLPDAPNEAMVYAKVNGRNTATWTRGNHRFVAISQADESVMRAVL